MLRKYPDKESVKKVYILLICLNKDKIDLPEKTTHYPGCRRSCLLTSNEKHTQFCHPQGGKNLWHPRYTVAAQACNKQLDTLSQQTVHIDGFPGHVRIDLL